jgi:hypothetical protein
MLLRLISLVSLFSAMILCCSPKKSKDKSNPMPNQGTSTDDQTEPMIGCVQGFSIKLNATPGWGTGDYKFLISYGSESTTCTGKLPLSECGTPSLSCTNQNIQISESGCALPANAHAWASIRSDNTYEDVSVEVFKNTLSIGKSSFKFAYQEVSAAGGMTCKQSPEQAMQLTVPQ